MTRSLDLGCGELPKNPFNADEVFGVDIREGLNANIRKADLATESIPFEDNSFEYVTAHDFLEHVPRVLYAPARRNAFVEVMNEVYRVLKPGGMFLSLTPAFPHSAAFQDPTHVNIITEQTFPYYFDDVNRWASCYGFTGAFKVHTQEWHGAHLYTLLQKVGMDPQIAAGPVSSLVKQYRSHVNFDVVNPDNDKEFELLQRTDIVGWWRYRRFFEPVFDCLSHTKSDKWLTVGDPFGSDAYHMTREGFLDVTPSNIGDHLLKESMRRGLIKDYRIENAESLSFKDDSFDYILCKEAFHHFPRPMIALYEMLRVARKAVVLIEPQDPYIDPPVMTEKRPAGYEASGNYVYTLSRRELEKVALGLDLPALATKGLCDIWYQGASEILVDETSEEFISYRNSVESYQALCAAGQHKYNYLLAIVFKERPDIDVRQYVGGWSITSFPGNPYLVKS